MKQVPIEERENGVSVSVTVHLQRLLMLLLLSYFRRIPADALTHTLASERKRFRGRKSGEKIEEALVISDSRLLFDV